MSYLVMFRIATDGDTMERVAQENADAIRGIAERAKERGAIHHAFYAGEGEVIVVDEWDDPAHFHEFFESEAPNIGPLMQAAGVQGPPGEAQSFKRLSTPDEF